MKLLLSYLIVTISLISCQEPPFSGSRVIGNLFFANMEADSLITPTRVRIPGNPFPVHLQPGDPGYVSHYELYAGIDGIGTVRLLNFQIRPVIEVHHPCLQFIDDETRVGGIGEGPFYLNMCRLPFPDLENQTLAVVSVAPTGIGTANPGYNFFEWGADMLAPESVTIPNCATNTRMTYVKEAVESYCDQLHKDYYIGNPWQMTKPRSGQFYGLVDGIDPRTNLATGGISFTVLYNLTRMTSLFIVADPDPGRLSEENFDRNLPPNPQGTVILLSERNGWFGYVDTRSFEGVWHGLMVSPVGDPIYFEYTLYTDLNVDRVWF